MFPLHGIPFGPVVVWIQDFFPGNPLSSLLNTEQICGLAENRERVCKTHLWNIVIVKRSERM
jgi:hypothetical protein